MNIFTLDNIAFSVGGHPVSYVELIGTLFGLASVYYASRANILTWSMGIVNEFFLFLLFFQVHLYADMFLQVYFFTITVYGWYNWKAKPAAGSISVLIPKHRITLGLILMTGSLLSGLFFKNIHLYLPEYFLVPAAYPFTDSFVFVASVLAIILLARKKIENFWIWIAIDIVCIALYFKKHIYFLSLEYLLFLGLAVYGLYTWRKKLMPFRQLE